MLRATHKLQFKTGKRSAKKIVPAREAASEAEPAPAPAPTRLPRITKLMALAIHLDHLLQTGQVNDQAELARLGHVSRARLTQIMDLNLLAPDIQEEILFLEQAGRGKELISERELRKIVAIHGWKEQKRMWESERAS